MNFLANPAANAAISDDKSDEIGMEPGEIDCDKCELPGDKNCDTATDPGEKTDLAADDSGFDEFKAPGETLNCDNLENPGEDDTGATTDLLVLFMREAKDGVDDAPEDELELKIKQKKLREIANKKKYQK